MNPDPDPRSLLSTTPDTVCALPLPSFNFEKNTFPNDDRYGGWGAVVGVGAGVGVGVGVGRRGKGAWSGMVVGATKGSLYGMRVRES